MLKSLMMSALIMGAIPATVAQAQTTRSVHVSTADLDLTTAQGRHKLDRRIDAALAEVCPADAAPPRTGLIVKYPCRDAAAADARRQRGDAIAMITARKGKNAVELARR